MDDPKLKLHGCLVPWEELKRVEELTGMDYRVHDIEAIYDLHEIAETLGYHIVQRKAYSF
jgi:hypothetical protein